MKHYIVTGMIAGLLVLGLTPSIAPAAQDEVIYGRQLMTEQEITLHQAKMRSFQTEQERAAYRQEQHQRMQQRAKEMGVTLHQAKMRSFQTEQEREAYRQEQHQRM